MAKQNWSDVLWKLTQRNKAAANLRGFRFRDGAVTATDTITTAMFFDIHAGLDCLVPSSLFMDSIAPTKNPIIKQDADGHTLHITDGDYTADIALQSTEMYDKNVRNPRSSEAKMIGRFDLLGVEDRLLPFFKVESSQTISSIVWFIDGYAYMTDNNLLARTPTTFNPEPGKVIGISRTFLELLASVKLEGEGEGFDIHLGERSLQAWFPNGGIETALMNRKPPVNFPQFCKQLDKLEMHDYPETVMTGLKTVCKFGVKRKHMLEFDERGIAVRDQSTAVVKILHPMPKIRVRCEHLDRILPSVPAMNLEADPAHFLVFRGNGVDGFLTVS